MRPLNQLRNKGCCSSYSRAACLLGTSCCCYNATDVAPVLLAASRRHVRMLEMEGQKLDFNAGHKYGAPAKRPRRSKAKEVALTPVSGPPPTSSTADLSV